MYINIDKTRYGHETVYIKQSYRTENGRTSTRTIANLGRLQDIKNDHPDDYEEWIKAQIKMYEDKSKESSEIIIKYNSEKKIEKDCINCYSGGYLFLQKIYYDLGLDKICSSISNNYKFEYDLNEILSSLIYSRILYPSSKSGTFEYSKTMIENSKFELHDIYRALDVLAENQELIQEKVYKNSLKLGARRDKVIYYDCTNYYFEIESESGIRKYGVSKEHRPNPIVGMGMMMDADGIPLAFDIFDGNKNEQITLRPLEQRIINDYGNSKFVICTDSGLSSNANKKFNDIQDRAFITAQSIKKMNKVQKEWALSSNGWHLPKDNREYDIDEILKDENKRHKYRNQVFYKEQWYNVANVDQRFITTFSIKYFDYQRHIRAEQIERAERAIKSADKNERTRKTDYKRLIKKVSVTEDGEVAEKKVYAINEDLIADEEQYDGFYCVATNLDDPAPEIVKVNSKRWEIEESFRIMKTEFKARPVYLSLENRITAHFLTCYLALMILRYVEKTVGPGFTYEEIIKKLKEMNFQKTSQGFIPLYTRNETTDVLHDKFGFRTDYEILPPERIRQIFHITKNRLSHSTKS